MRSVSAGFGSGPYREVARNSPHAIALDVKDGGLVDVVANEAAKSQSTYSVERLNGRIESQVYFVTKSGESDCQRMFL